MGTQTKKAFLCDFDDLLLRSHVPWFEQCAARYQRFLGVTISAQEFSLLPKLDIAAVARDICRRDDLLDANHVLDELGRAAKEAERSRLESPWMPGAEAFVADLAAGDRPAAVVTNGDLPWVDIWRERMLRRAFDVVVTREDVGPGRGKPAPDPYLVALERLGVHGEDAVVLDDSASGIHSGRAAGVRRLVAVSGVLTQHETFPDGILRLETLQGVTPDSLEQALNEMLNVERPSQSRGGLSAD